jgi:hypothetical protein
MTYFFFSFFLFFFYFVAVLGFELKALHLVIRRLPSAYLHLSQAPSP